MTYAGDKEVENVINARDRHCRIGKVTRKASVDHIWFHWTKIKTAARQGYFDAIRSYEPKRTPA